MVGAVKLMRTRPRVARMRYGSIRWPTLIATQVPQRVLKTRSRRALNGICWVAGSNGRTAIERTLPDAHARDEPLRSRNGEPTAAVCSSAPSQGSASAKDFFLGPTAGRRGDG